jgi:hypothetical protein
MSSGPSYSRAHVLVDLIESQPKFEYSSKLKPKTPGHSTHFAFMYSRSEVKTQTIVMVTIRQRRRELGERSRYSDYELCDPWLRVRAQTGQEFSPPRRPDRFCGPFILLSDRYRGSFRGSKAARDLNLTIYFQLLLSQENMDLYIHFPIRLHGVVLNKLDTGKT